MLFFPLLYRNILEINTKFFYNCDIFNKYILISPNNNIICSSNSLILNKSGEYKIIILKDVTLSLSLWGAGGGGPFGGYGGFSQGNIKFLQYENYTIWVGEGGIFAKSGSDGTFGGGGFVGSTNHPNFYVGTGGGLTGIFLNQVSFENSIIIAGGGGGGASPPIGGNGGGLQGLPGNPSSSNSRPGQGGTQFNGGEGGVHTVYGSGNSGNKLKGGNATASISNTFSGGGGGGGYYGGGSGNLNNELGGAGGGGSGYIHPNKIINGSTSTFFLTVDHILNKGYPSNDGLIILKFLYNFNNSNSLKIYINFNLFIVSILLLSF